MAKYIATKVFHKKKRVPHLATAMALAEAGNIALGAAAGCDPATIQRAKTEGIRPHIADAIMEAICTREFCYLKPGRRASRYE